MSGTLKRLWLVVRLIVFCPDSIEMVDRALRTNYLPTYLPKIELSFSLRSCRLIPLFSLLSWYPAQSCCSFYLVLFLLLAHSPAGFREISETFFSSDDLLFVWPLFWGFVLSGLGDENQSVICAEWCLMAMVLASCAFRDLYQGFR